MIINGETYGIGIMTYSKRREYITNLINDIRNQSEIPIYIAVNCDYKLPFDDEYRRFMLELCMEYSEVYCSFYLKFRGCAKIWNDLIINTSYDNLIILNDDVSMKNNFISDLIAHQVNTNNNTVLKINNGWTGFCVNKNFMKRVGFFNENYIGIGFEDTEFVWRLGEFPYFMSTDFISLTKESVNTFPNMENLEPNGQKVYSSYNNELINRKAIASRETNFRPYEDVYDNNFDRIF